MIATSENTLKYCGEIVYIQVGRGVGAESIETVKEATHAAPPSLQQNHQY
jgi:hypothetical protein